MTVERIEFDWNGIRIIAEVRTGQKEQLDFWWLFNREEYENVIRQAEARFEREFARRMVAFHEANIR